jgi:hypothetical protein
MSQFVLEPKTLKILENFSGFNKGIVITPGNILALKSSTGSVRAFANLDQSFDKQIPIYDLKKFFSILSLFPKPTLMVDDKVIRVQQDGRSVNYTLAPLSVIVHPTERREDGTFMKVVYQTVDISFDLTEKVLTDAIKAAGVIGVPELAIIGDGSTVNVVTLSTKNPTSDLYKEEIGETDKEFKLVFKIENLKLLQADYKVEHSFTLNKGRICPVRFYNDSLEYFVAAEKESTVPAMGDE